MKSSVGSSYAVAYFFMLLFIFTVPFLLIQIWSDARILPGIPLAGLAFLCPALAALVLELRRNKNSGVRQLLARAFDFRRIKKKIWYVPLLFLYPFIVTLSYLFLQLTDSDVPAPHITPTSTLLLSIGFFMGALAEELGWSGYAAERLQKGHGPLMTGIIIGTVWAVWHWIPLRQVHRPPLWILWWMLNTISIRVIMMWLFNKTGRSVFGMALFHMTLNLSWQLFPIQGSHFNMPIVALMTTGTAVFATYIWQSKASKQKAFDNGPETGSRKT